MIGDVAIDQVVELALDPAFAADQLLPDFNDEVVAANRALLSPRYMNADSKLLVMSIHSWIVRSGDNVVLIDTCCGNQKPRPDFPLANMLDVPYLERLEAAGVRAQDVDYVLCTHLHVDHCGWNTQLRNGKWVPTFPNAKYIFSQTEYDQWNPQDPTYPKAGMNPTSGVNAGVFEDSVLPIVEHGLAQMVTGRHAIDRNLSIEPAPGHTFGSIVIKLDSKSDKGLFCGDVMHHPIQVLRPDWNSAFCDVPALARHTRRRVLGYCADEGAVLMPAHFAAPHAVRVQRAGENFTFQPA